MRMKEKNLISAEPVMNSVDMKCEWKLFIEVLEEKKPLGKGHRRKKDVKMGIKIMFCVNMGRIICVEDCA